PAIRPHDPRTRTVPTPPTVGAMVMSSLTAPHPELDSVWKEVRERLRATLNSQTYKFAFAGARPVELDGERLVLAVDTELLRQWIRQRYLPLLRDALFEVRGEDLEVELRVEPPAGDAEDAADEDAARDGPRELPSLTPRRPLGLQPRFTFEAFVTGPS